MGGVCLSGQGLNRDGTAVIVVVPLDGMAMGYRCAIAVRRRFGVGLDIVQLWAAKCY